MLAMLLTVLFLFFPYGYLGADELNGVDQAAVLVPCCVAVFIMAVTVFLYKNLPLQKSFVGISALIVLAVVIMLVYLLADTYAVDGSPVEVKPRWGFSGLLLIAALISLYGAYRNISADQKLLRSYDRLR
jgi:hypothetical protein